MPLLQKIAWIILIPFYVSCSDDKPEPLVSSWHEDAETAEQQLSAIETAETSNTKQVNNSWYENAEIAEQQLPSTETSEQQPSIEAQTSNRTIIFDASTTNTTLIGNARGPLGSLTGSPGNLTLKNPIDDFNVSGFTSKSDINTLKGSNLTSADTITVTITVPNITGARLRSNGIQFGIVKAPSFGKKFDTSGDLHIEMEASNAGGKILTFLDGVKIIDSGFKATTYQLTNGFTATLVANAKEYTFTLVSVGKTSPLTVSGTFSGTQFVDLVGPGHFYYTAQQFNTKQSLVSSITQARIEISSAP